MSKDGLKRRFAPPAGEGSSSSTLARPSGPIEVPLAYRRHGPTLATVIRRMLEKEVDIRLIKRMYGLDPDDPESTCPEYDMFLALLPIERSDKKIPTPTHKAALSAARIVFAWKAAIGGDLGPLDRLFDRIDGKPAQRIHLGPDRPETLADLDDEELTRIAAGETEGET